MNTSWRRYTWLFALLARTEAGVVWSICSRTHESRFVLTESDALWISCRLIGAPHDGMSGSPRPQHPPA